VAGHGLTWWRGPAWLTDAYTMIDPAKAETYDAETLGLEVLFDLAAVTTSRQTLGFVAQYGFLETPPGAQAQEHTTRELFWAAHVRLLLHIQMLDPTGSARTIELDGTEYARAGTLFVPTAALSEGTLLTVILDRLCAVQTTRLPIALCPTDGRFFSPANPRARYCRKACAQTAASWRVAHQLTKPRRTKGPGGLIATGRSRTVRGPARVDGSPPHGSHEPPVESPRDLAVAGVAPHE
jgi:hypothetical protein